MSPRKRRRVFLWIFLAVQVLFAILIVIAVASLDGTPAECEGSFDVESCNAEDDAYQAAAVWIAITVWAAVDIILGVSYAIYRLTRRSTGEIGHSG